MDERALNELLECSVCLEQLDATSKVLQCQHTFCRRCLEEIVATKNELRCPECRMLVELRVDELPTNILLIRLLEGLKNCKAGITGQSSSANSSPSHTQPSSPGSAAGGSRTSPIHKVVNTSQPCSKALYNYDAKEPGDLTFKKGDVILLRRQVDDNWYHGELNSQHGFFPATYVQVITPLPQEVPKCKALYDFVISDKNEKDCLTFQKDEILTVIRRVDDNWAEGKLGERIGIFPISFVEMNDSAKWLINNQTQINARPNAVATPSQGTSNNGSPIHTANHTPSHTANHTPNHTANHTPSHTPNHTPSHTANHTPNHTANHTPNHTANHTPSHSTNHTPSHSTNHTPIHSANHTPSHSAAPSSATPGGSSSNNNGQLETSPPGGSGSGSGGLSSCTPGGGIPLAVLSNPTIAAVQRGAGQKRHSLTCISSHKVASQVPPQQRHSMELSGSLSLVPLLSSAPASVTSSPSKSSSGSSREHDNGPTSGHMGPNGLVLYVALYNYKPQKDDEVELRKGDYYTVSEKCQDGWFKGTCLRTGNFGVFPGNYVQLVKISSKQTSSSVTRGAAPGAVAVGPMSNSSPSSSASSASGGGCSGGSPARQSPQVAKVQQHVTVSRAHSFPKTSPLASMDYQVRAGHESATGGGARTAQGTPTHTSRSSGTVTVPPRPDPSINPTLAGGTPTRLAGRAVPNPAGAAAGLSSTSGTPCGSAHTSPAHMQSRGYAALSNGASGSASTGAESSRKSSHHHSSSHGHSRGSPRSARKSERSKHSSASAERMGSSKHGACPSSSAGATPGGHRTHSSEVPPHAPARTPHSGGSATSALHSMAANATLTPPNVVVGAVGGNPPPPPPAPREKEKEKKKDKDRLGLMKRLTKSKKSKSPPPDPTDGASSSDSGPAHQRCRCIVPYPPQSDIELELKLGDIVFVHKRRDDGWYKGTLQRTGKTGLFPGSFVESF